MGLQMPSLRDRWLTTGAALTILMGGCGDDEPAFVPPSVTSVVSESTSTRSSVVEEAAEPTSTIAPVVEEPVEPPSDPSSSVDGTASDDGRVEAVAALAEQRAKWEATGITTYEFTLFWGQLTLLYGDYRVTVVDGRPAGVARMDPGELDPGWEAEVPGTIDQVFDFLQPWVGGADLVDARYDPDNGYPVAVRIDRIESAIDDEFEMRISDLTVGTG